MSVRAILSAACFALTPLAGEQLSIHLSGGAQPYCWDTDEIVAAATKNAAGAREKALALHGFGMAHFIHYDGPIEERGDYITDPMKLIGVYGYALCGNNSSAMNALYNTAGLRARKRTLPAHAVAEVWFEGKWNYIDTDMFGYVLLDDGRRMASVDELVNDAGLFLRQARPPDPFYPYDKKEDMASVFRNARADRDYHAYTNAHMMNLALRNGESITFYYRPQGRHLLRELRTDIGTVYKDYWVEGAVRRGSLAWRDDPKEPATYGNGLLEYSPDLRSPSLLAENPGANGIAAGQGRAQPPLKAARQGQTASLVIEAGSPFVIVGRQNDLTNFEDNSGAAVVSGLFWRAGAADENRILVSADSGQTWRKVWENRHLGAVPFEVYLTRWVEGRYGYKVKFEWTDSNGSGRAGLEGLRFQTWTAASPMALPRLAPGENTFHVASRPRRTYYHESRWERGEGLIGQQVENLTAAGSPLLLRPADAASPGVLTFALGPDGVVEEVRVSIRARAARGSQGVTVALALSEDGGKNWKQLESFAPDPEHEMNHMWFNHVLKGRTLAGSRCRLRVSVSGGGLEKVIANSAVRQESAVPGSLRITHRWREQERERSSTRSFGPGALPASYTVTAGTGLAHHSLRIEAAAQ